MGLTFATRRRRRFLRWRTLLVLLLVAAVAAGAVAFVRSRDSDPPIPTAETDAFLGAWDRGDIGTMAVLVDAPPADFATAATSLVRSLPQSTAKYTSTGVVRTKTGATSTYHARVDLAGFGPVEWDGTLAWTRTKSASPRSGASSSHRTRCSRAAPGQRVTASRTWPRAAILASDGSQLAGNSSIVTIGIEPTALAESRPDQAAPAVARRYRPAAVDAAAARPSPTSSSPSRRSRRHRATAPSATAARRCPACSSGGDEATRRVGAASTTSSGGSVRSPPTG